MAPEKRDQIYRVRDRIEYRRRKLQIDASVKEVCGALEGMRM